MNHQLPSVAVLKLFSCSELPSACVSPENMATEPPWSFSCAVETVGHNPLGYLSRNPTTEDIIFVPFTLFFLI